MHYTDFFRFLAVSRPACPSPQLGPLVRRGSRCIPSQGGGDMQLGVHVTSPTMVPRSNSCPVASLELASRRPVPVLATSLTQKETRRSRRTSLSCTKPAAQAVRQTPPPRLTTGSQREWQVPPTPLSGCRRGHLDPPVLRHPGNFHPHLDHHGGRHLLIPGGSETVLPTLHDY